MPMYAPRVMRSPWAKFTTPVALYVMRKPTAASAAMAPAASPLASSATNVLTRLRRRWWCDRRRGRGRRGRGLGHDAGQLVRCELEHLRHPDLALGVPPRQV